MRKQPFIVLWRRGAILRSFGCGVLAFAAVTVFAVSANASVTLTFQDGVNSYQGTQDTQIDQDAPDMTFGNDVTVVIDGPGGGSVPNTGLLRFDDIFGNGAGQIPLGATIASAKLSLWVDPGNGGQVNTNVHRMLQAWSETSTWNGLVDGISPDGVEAAFTPEVQLGAVSSGAQYDLDVTASVQQWSMGASNFGWALIADDNSPDGWAFLSSEYADASSRPRLEVTFIPEPGSFMLVTAGVFAAMIRRQRGR